MKPLIVVMGISGVGKSAVGHALAARLRIAYADGDDLHSDANIALMSAGTPLTDEDRWPWLADVGVWLSEHDGVGGVISCSALRRAYRVVLVEAAPRTQFLHLTGDPAVIRTRMEQREHFMAPTLLASQERTLEPLQADENGWAFDIAPTPAEIVDDFVSRLSPGDHR